MSSLNAQILDQANALAPSVGDTIEPSDPRIDPVYGGRKGALHGAPVWRYYQTILDSSGRSGGSTCGVVVDYLASLAGWPPAFINRAEDDAWAPGGGYRPGASISDLVGEAKRRGVYQDASGPDFALQEGDVYHVDHPPKTNSDHVGVVAAVLRGGILETVDGGQGSGSTIKRNQRTLSQDGRTLVLDGAAARVLGAIRFPLGGGQGVA